MTQPTLDTGRQRGKPRHILPIIVAMVIAIAPHVPGLPVWISLWCLVMWSYMLLHLKLGWPLPGSGLCRILAMVGIVGVFFTYQVRLGGDAFVGMLAAMAAVKPFEMPNHRHRMIAILLTYFIVVTSLFRWESLWAFIHLFFSVFVTTIALVRINHPHGRFRDSFKLTGRIMARAVPLTLVLFFLFPRLPGSFFGVRQDSVSGRSGFAEQLRPGSLSRMGRDNSLAFRAVFESPLPPELGLYWRSIVFDTFDGRIWRAGVPRPHDPEEEIYDPGGDLVYTIRLQPHRSKWLPVLDLPVSPPENSRMTSHFTVRAAKRVTQPLKYRLHSRPPPATTDWGRLADALGTDPGLSMGSAVPSQIQVDYRRNPRAVELARELTRNAGSVDRAVLQVLAHFRDQDFAYSLTPPRLGRSPVDEFLFSSRRGYCEHFASAFAYMMNSVGVPARVVGGYLGGEVNPLGHYITVRNAYAHAWVEVRHPARGWVRVDPTLAVSPERLRSNPDGSLAFGEIRGENISLWRKFRWGLEAVNLGWEAWFTNYASSEQKALLRQLGFDTPSGFWNWNTPILRGTFIALILVMAFVAVRRVKYRASDPVMDAYWLFCRRLARVGILKDPHMGAMEFAGRAREARPDLARPIEDISRLYVRLRYAKPSPETGQLIRQLGRRVRDFKPGASPPITKE